MTRRRHWAVGVAIAARDAAIARQWADDAAALGPLAPLAGPMRQIMRQFVDVFDALAPVLAEVGGNLAAVGEAPTPPQPPRHAGPPRPEPERSRRPRRHQ